MEGSLSKNNINSVTHSVMLDASGNSNSLLISFGGIGNRLPIPIFEFMRSLDKFSINKVFIRDFKKNWYTNGIHGVSESPEQTVEYLKGLIHKHGREKCVFIGNSAGGYAAMLYGRMLGIDEVHAFSPQTFIDPWHRFIYRDRRWKEEMLALNPDSRRLFDLKKVFAKHKNNVTKFYIYWDENHRLDNVHAARMRGAFIHHKKYQHGGHAVIKHIRDSGEIDSILTESFAKYL